VPATAIHRLVERCRAGDCAAAVARLRSGWLVLGERQVFAGYCLLLPDPVVGHLNALQEPARGVFLDDLARAGDALIEVTGATRINYAMFGNAEPALHAHLFPRHADEPAATRTAQPWAFDWQAAPAFDEAVHGGLRRRLGAALAAHSVPGGPGASHPS
jgi:diadenosine tetraphosphate (Ap4A) HIT family hydrolase